MSFCPKCGKVVQVGMAFCGSCGARLGICPSCGKEVAKDQAYCPSCGAQLPPGAAGPYRADPGGQTAGPTSTQPPGMAVVSPKSRAATAILACPTLLGPYGAHRFYTGKIGTAVTMLVLGIVGWATCWFLVGIPFLIVVGIWAFVDFIIAIAGSAKDNEGRPITKW